MECHCRAFFTPVAHAWDLTEPACNVHCCHGGRGTRACRLSMGSPRRRTSGMHSAAAPRSAAMRRFSSAASSFALASASAATRRNAPCTSEKIA